MSASITLSEQATWWTSGLFLSKLLDQIQAIYPDDGQARDTLNASSILGSFSVDAYDQEFGTLLARMIYTVAKDTRDGAIQPGPVINFAGHDFQAEYVQELENLVVMFENDGRFARRLTG